MLLCFLTTWDDLGGQATGWIAEKVGEVVIAASGVAEQAAEWVAEKGGEVVNAAPGAAEQVSEY